MRCGQCHRPVSEGLVACPDDGAPALASVDEALTRGPMPLTQAVKVVDRALSALSGLHATGQVHGALGPGAVLYRQKGEDLTVVVWPGEGPPPAAYVAPEGPGAPAADCFAVGVMLHHMITGRMPAAGGDLPSLAGHALQDVPEALDALIGALAAADPARRPASIAAVQASLQNLELDSTLSGARLAAVRAAAAVPDTPARQVTLSAPFSDDVDPHEDTFIRDRASLEADVRAVDSPSPSDPFADTVIGSREEVEAQVAAASEDEGAQDTLLGMTPAPGPAAAAAMASLDASTQLLPESQPVAEAPGRWILFGILGGLAIGGAIAAALLL